MPIALTAEQIRALRQRAQHLDPAFASSVGVAAIVHELGGIQAQDSAAARLAIRARSTQVVAADVDAARVEQRSIVRTWAQRGTLHLIAADDLGWMLALLGPIFIAGTRRRYAELGLDDKMLARGTRIVRDLLANEAPLTRAEIVERLERHGMTISGQARPALLRHAALSGAICFGPERGSEPTYVLIDDWTRIGRGPSGDAAHDELALRYLRSYGPATPQDQAAWSGLPLAPIRAAWRRLGDRLAEITIDGAPAWMLADQRGWLDDPAPDPAAIHLLPAFDIYLLGYRSRDLILAPQHTKRINAGGGMLRPALLLDGQVAGTWAIERSRDRSTIAVTPFADLSARSIAALDAEVDHLARFLDTPTTLRIEPPRA